MPLGHDPTRPALEADRRLAGEGSNAAYNCRRHGDALSNGMSLSGRSIDLSGRQTALDGTRGSRVAVLWVRRRWASLWLNDHPESDAVGTLRWPQIEHPPPRALRNLPVPPVIAPVLTAPGTLISVPSVVMVFLSFTSRLVLMLQPSRAVVGSMRVHRPRAWPTLVFGALGRKTSSTKT
jgi:hypothetical protein